jgi:WD40 repeat protein
VRDGRHLGTEAEPAAPPPAWTARASKTSSPVHREELETSATSAADFVTYTCTLDAERVASSSADGTIRIWNPRTGELLKALECGHKLGAL